MAATNVKRLVMKRDILIMADKNQSEIKLAKNAEFYERTKHINIKYHKIREYVYEKQVEVEYVKSSENVADLFI